VIFVLISLIDFQISI